MIDFTNKIILAIFSFRKLALCLFVGLVVFIFPGCSNMLHKTGTEKFTKDKVQEQKSDDTKPNVVVEIHESSPHVEAKPVSVEGNEMGIEENFAGDINENNEGAPETIVEKSLIEPPGHLFNNDTASQSEYTDDGYGGISLASLVVDDEKEGPRDANSSEVIDESEYGSKSGNIKKDNLESSVPQMSNQELIDSALDYWQASNNFWEQGELESAIDALDEAYSLILNIDDVDPELLQQKEDLRITISRRIIEVYSSRSSVANGTHKAIPLDMNEHVKKALDLFKGRQRKFFLDAYVRSGRYRPAIVRALKDAGLPEELSWLPLIESGFKVRAISSSRALGMWQFIASTGYKFGLKRDDWVDERMDPDKSTKAAVAYLTELHQIFGDWTTALAAYNCGENRVLRNIRAQQIDYLDSFWDLYKKLPSETAFYVPQFLAVLHIINSPETYGFELPPVDEELKSVEVTIKKQASLKTIAEKINLSFRELEELNPELRQDITPNDLYQLKVPVGKGESLLAAIDEISVYSQPVPLYIMHKVSPGESLYWIAKKYKTSINSIMRINNLVSGSYVKTGWDLKIPTSRYSEGIVTPSDLSSDADMEKEKQKELKKELKYVVKKGDTLWSIANKHKTTVNSIKVVNGLKDSALSTDQVLTILSGQIVETFSEVITEHEVKKGDSPYKIAKLYKMKLEDFLRLNNLNLTSLIYPGTKVVVR